MLASRKRYKVAIDTRFLCQKQRGMPAYLYALCAHLPRILPEVDFIFLINKAFEHNVSPDEYQTRISILTGITNVEFVNIDCESEITWEQYYLPKYLKHNSVDLLHMPGNRVCFFTRVKQVVTLHDAIEWKQISYVNILKSKSSLGNKLYSIKSVTYRFLTYWLGLRRVDWVVTISKYSSADILKLFPFLANRLSYAYHGLPTIYEKPISIVPRAQRKHILMLGGEGWQKNPYNMIDAYCMLSPTQRKQYPLVVVGIANLNNSDIVNYVSSKNCAKNITFKGWISDKDLLALFASSIALIFASREEGFGFPLIQAMSLGTPVVCSNADVLVELGKDSTLRADSEDPDGLSANLSLLIDNEDKWTELSEKGVAYAKSYTWEHSMQALAECYRKLLLDKN